MIRLQRCQQYCHNSCTQRFFYQTQDMLSVVHHAVLAHYKFILDNFFVLQAINILPDYVKRKIPYN